MANNSVENGNPSSSFGGEEEDPSDLLGVEEKVLEAFLDSALENDHVLKRILNEGLTQIIKAAIRLLNLQRRRDKGQSQGQGREKKLASKTVMNSRDPEGTTVRGSPIVVEEERPSSSKDADNNPPIATMTLVGKTSLVEGEGVLGGLPHDDHDNQLDPNPERDLNELEIPPIDDAEKDVLFCQGGLNLIGGIEKTPTQKRDKGRKRTLKHVCYFCQKTFRTPSKLEAHLTTHIKERPFPCAVCGQEFAEKGNLEDHIRRHLNEKAHKCPHPGCTSFFVTGGELKVHSRVHSGEKPFKCPHQGCTSAFATTKDLKRHSRVHSGEKPFKCNLCGIGFGRKDTLGDHIRRHLKEKPYKCNFCGRDFVKKGILDEHIRRHLKEKWFKCPHPGCSSSFVRGSDLRRHARIHSGEKPLACPHPGCGKTFGRSEHLRRHLRTHSGEKPFVCSFPGCGKAFRQKGSMTTHLKAHDRSPVP